jgi:hypothetical protein
MSDLKPVSRPPFLLDGRGGMVFAVVAIAVALAILKPWGTGGARAPIPSQAVVASPSPTPTDTPNPTDGYSRVYDPLIFGDRQLQADWGLWPAGYLSTFGFAMRSDQSSPPGGPSASGPTASQPAAPVWPNAIDIPLGNHLLLIGVSTPIGFKVDRIHMTRFLASGRTEVVPLLELPSPWPNHFAVIGIDGGLGANRPIFWAAGRYRLDLMIDPGSIQRSIEVRVEGPAPSAGTDSPAPSIASARP